jgi:hypothetical protein
MSERPTPVTGVAWLMIAAGVVGIVYHFPDLQTQPQWEVALILAMRLLAIINGIFLLKGGHWARWR